LIFKIINESDILGAMIPNDYKKDSFARTVISKCNTYDLWDKTYGYYVGDELVGIMITTFTKRNPITANLQILFTYYRYRGNGYAKAMVLETIRQAHEYGCEYYRVSSEASAVEFYEKIGFKFFCKQKSGTQLSIFKVNNSIIEDKDFIRDENMDKMYFRKGKGGCVEILGEYKKEDLSFGTELEFSNIPKSKEVPKELGKWEYSELDVVNTKGEYAFKCADPRGTEVPVGGEINTIPSKNFVDQVDKIMNIIKYFKEDDVDVGLTAHTHLHVHIDGIEDDPEALARLVNYIYDNQETTLRECYAFNEDIIPKEKRFSKIKRYLKFDGGRPLPEWFKDNAVDNVDTFDGFLDAIGWGIKKEPIRYQRYHINLHALKNSKTIEFRCFRGSLDETEYLDMFAFVQEFILNGLNGGDSVQEILNKRDYKFPRMQFNEDQAIGWQDTKYDSNRCGKKNREYWQADKASEKIYEMKKKEKIMGNLHLINYMGANGVGKSTRTFHLVDYMKNTMDFTEFKYGITRKGNDEKEETIGLLFENGWLVLGKFSKENTQWVSLDSAILSKWEHRIAFIEDMSKRGEIKVVFMEGYFNNRSRQSSPENLKAHGVSKVEILTSYYNDISEFIDRTNGRTGKNRGMEWAEQSPGWNDNKLFDKLYNEFIEEVNESAIVERIDINSPRDTLVNRFFDKSYVKKEEVNVMDEWL